MPRANKGAFVWPGQGFGVAAGILFINHSKQARGGLQKLSIPGVQAQQSYMVSTLLGKRETIRGHVQRLQQAPKGAGDAGSLIFLRVSVVEVGGTSGLPPLNLLEVHFPVHPRTFSLQ